jgi:hypothetical protein
MASPASSATTCIAARAIGASSSAQEAASPVRPASTMLVSSKLTEDSRQPSASAMSWRKRSASGSRRKMATNAELSTTITLADHPVIQIGIR